MYYPVFRHLKSQLKELLVILECDAHKKVSQDLTEKKQDLIKMSIILKVLTEFKQDFILARFYHNQLRKSWFNLVNICQA